MSKNTNTQLSVQTEMDESIIRKLALEGDLSGLTSEEMVHYYGKLCARVGLDPVTRPFTLMKLNDKEVLYCSREGTSQLSNLHKLTRQIIAREERDGCCIVTARVTAPDGRSDESIGVVPIEKEEGSWEEDPRTHKRYFKSNGTFKKFRGEDLANAMMKAETKAKRRATLDLVGLGMLDESEIESLRETGAVAPKSPEEEQYEAALDQWREDCLDIDALNARVRRQPDFTESMLESYPERPAAPAIQATATIIQEPESEPISGPVAEEEPETAWEEVPCQFFAALEGKKLGEVPLSVLEKMIPRLAAMEKTPAVRRYTEYVQAGIAVRKGGAESSAAQEPEPKQRKPRVKKEQPPVEIESAVVQDEEPIPLATPHEGLRNLMQHSEVSEEALIAWLKANRQREIIAVEDLEEAEIQDLRSAWPVAVKVLAKLTKQLA